MIQSIGKRPRQTAEDLLATAKRGNIIHLPRDLGKNRLTITQRNLKIIGHESPILNHTI